MSTSSGITARSWKSSTPITPRPYSVCSCMRSASSLEMIAVDDIAMTPPAMSPWRHERPIAMEATTPIAITTATCVPPKPEHQRGSCPSAAAG